MSRKPDQTTASLHAVDWNSAASLSSEELDRQLADDHDEIDDNPATTADELERMESRTSRTADVLSAQNPAKVQMTVAVDPRTLAAFQATGPDWQERVDAILRDALRRRA